MEPTRQSPDSQESPGQPPVEPAGAGGLLRLGAFAIDALLVSVGLAALEYCVWRFAPARAPQLFALGAGILVVGYWGWATARYYHTPGQGFAGLTLARSDYQPLTTRRAYLRALLFGATTGMFLPNAILMLFDKKRRTIHDRLTTTWVYALPDVPRYRRWITAAAGLALIGVSSAAGIVALSDMVEERARLSPQEVAASADAD